jgi:hypothetical protein
MMRHRPYNSSTFSSKFIGKQNCGENPEENAEEKTILILRQKPLDTLARRATG